MKDLQSWGLEMFPSISALGRANDSTNEGPAMSPGASPAKCGHGVFVIAITSVWRASRLVRGDERNGRTKLSREFRIAPRTYSHSIVYLSCCLFSSVRALEALRLAGSCDCRLQTAEFLRLDYSLTTDRTAILIGRGAAGSGRRTQSHRRTSDCFCMVCKYACSWWYSIRRQELNNMPRSAREQNALPHCRPLEQ